jgi:hypothetical protein
VSSFSRRTILALPAAAAVLRGQNEEDFQVYTEHPRLLLPARRRRLLERERERTSVRWQQFETLVAGKVQMPEPGLAWALYGQIAKSEAFSRQAAGWALQASDPRQIALVFDWCQTVLREPEAAALRTKLETLLAAPPRARTLPVMRDRAFAAVALGGEAGKRELAAIVKGWWRAESAPALKAGTYRYSREEGHALFELLHAVRDSINIDLREDAPKYFKELPAYHILSYYPASFPAAENEYRIPFYEGGGDPDLRVAALARATDLSMVAFDTNAQETQFVQGWLIHDRFLMRGAFGIPYELLWANPYQPGLSYYHLPLAMHQSTAGRLVLRSSWEDDATWFHYGEGKVQVFEEGVRKDRSMKSPAPIDVAGTIVHFGRDNMEFRVESDELQNIYVIGLAANTGYDVELDEHEISEATTDAGGILNFQFLKCGDRAVRLHKPFRLKS